MNRRKKHKKPRSIAGKADGPAKSTTKNEDRMRYEATRSAVIRKRKRRRSPRYTSRRGFGACKNDNKLRRC